MNRIKTTKPLIALLVIGTTAHAAEVVVNNRLSACITLWGKGVRHDNLTNRGNKRTMNTLMKLGRKSERSESVLDVKAEMTIWRELSDCHA